MKYFQLGLEHWENSPSYSIESPSDQLKRIGSLRRLLGRNNDGDMEVLLKTLEKWQRLVNCSLRSKRFGKAFRTFNALFAFLAAGKLGRVLRSPQFLRSQKAKNASNGRKALRNACYAGYVNRITNSLWKRSLCAVY